MPHKDPLQRLAYSRAWAAKNRDKILGYARAANAKPATKRRKKVWQDKNRKRLNALSLEHYHANREVCLARTRRWQDAHPERVRQTHVLATERRRARKRGAKGWHSEAQWLARVEFFGWCCRYCGDVLDTFTLTKDHAQPLSRGGSEWASNLVPACFQCNSHKRTRTFTEFMALRKALGLCE